MWPPCASAQVRRDSAGVAIVSYDSRSKAPPTWRLSPKPHVVIGGVTGTGPTELTGVTSVGRLSDGRIVVANAATREVRIFRNDGVFLQSASRRGQGPGELQELDSLFIAQDTIVALDGRAAVRLYTSSGTYVRSIPPLGNKRHLPMRFPFGRLAGGGLVMFYCRIEPGKAPCSDSLDIGVLAADGRLDRILGAVPQDKKWTKSRYTSNKTAFGAKLHATTRSGGVCVGYSQSYCLQCYDAEGKLILSVRREWPRRAVSDSARRAYLEHLRGDRDNLRTYAANSWLAHRAQVAEHAEFASYYPPFSALLSSHVGELWVRDFRVEDDIPSAPRVPSTATTWSVYGANGAWIGVVTLPARFTPYDIGVDYVLGVSTNEDDVESVVLYGLSRPGAR